jgi:hypothetical protein
MKMTINLNKPRGRFNCAEAERDAVDGFRSWLQTVITAGQSGQNERLPRLPRSKTPAYCRSLANLPDNALAKELAAPVLAVLEQIEYAATVFQRNVPAPPPAERGGERAPSAAGSAASPEQEAYERVLWQLDVALAQMSRRLAGIASARARRSKGPE